MELFVPWLVAAGLLYVLRRLEHWLHQHIFKVGWLVTKQYQTTTILYYAFFLPGIVLYELVIWMTAGFLNVRADRAIAWPEKQEIGELKLSFIKLSKNTGQLPLAIISTTPLIAGLAVVAFIASNRLDFQGFVSSMGSGMLDELGAAFSRLVSAPDFWIWIYLVFTISNTMWPDVSKLRGWRIILIGLAVVGGVLIVIGAGNQVIVETLSGPVTNALNSLSRTLAVIIGIDLFVVAVLGTIEAIIERITGDSATFKNGKMITLRREELIKQQAAERTTARQQKATRAPALPAGPPSIYKMPLPIPGAPGKEAVTRDEGIIISKPPTPAIASPSAPPAIARTAPAVIPGTVADKPGSTTESKPAVFSPAENKPAASTPAVSPSPFGSKPTLPSGPSSPTPGARPALSAAGTSTSPAPKTGTPISPSSLRSGLLDDDEDDEGLFDEDEIEDDEDEDDDTTYEDAEDPA
ncbi:MAG: hypothetical protein K8I30_05505 [Anaerolineae bacterium]|nr:hypothetical protein [Anaerolineae bacterium]